MLQSGLRTTLIWKNRAHKIRQIVSRDLKTVSRKERQSSSKMPGMHSGQHHSILQLTQQQEPVLAAQWAPSASKSCTGTLPLPEQVAGNARQSADVAGNGRHSAGMAGASVPIGLHSPAASKQYFQNTLGEANSGQQKGLLLRSLLPLKKTKQAPKGVPRSSDQPRSHDKAAKKQPSPASVHETVQPDQMQRKRVQRETRASGQHLRKRIRLATTVENADALQRSSAGDRAANIAALQHLTVRPRRIGAGRSLKQSNPLDEASLQRKIKRRLERHKAKCRAAKKQQP